MNDDRTAGLNLPLPHIDNSLSEDVGRLRSAITAFDVAVMDRAHVVHEHAISEVTGLTAALAGKQPALGYNPINTALIGVANGVARLNASGQVDPSQFPSFVDAVVTGATAAGFPATGSSGRLYVAIDSSKSYRWAGASYAEVSRAPATSDEVTEGAANRYHTPARVLGVVLAGLSTATNAAISAADSVLSALGKLQKQITDLTTQLGGKQSAMSVAVVTGTSQSAASAQHCVLTNAAITTVNLPASPLNGDYVVVTVLNGLSTNLVNPASKPINGEMGVMTIDIPHKTFSLRYANGGWFVL